MNVRLGKNENLTTKLIATQFLLMCLTLTRKFLNKNKYKSFLLETNKLQSIFCFPHPNYGHTDK